MKQPFFVAVLAAAVVPLVAATLQGSVPSAPDSMQSLPAFFEVVSVRANRSNAVGHRMQAAVDVVVIDRVERPMED